MPTKRKRPEDQLQGYVFDLIRLYGVKNLIAYHVPNAGKRLPRTGAYLKRLGMLPGTADIAIVLPGGAARFLELKAPKGTMSGDQHAFMALCLLNGAPYRVARTPEEAAAVLHGWGCIRENPLKALRPSSQGAVA